MDIKIITDIPSPSSRRPSTSAASIRTSSTTQGRSTIEVGSKLVLAITVDRVKGISGLDLASVHLQLRLSSLAGSSISAEDIFASSAVDLQTGSLLDVALRRKVTLQVTSEIQQHLANGYAPVEFFAEIRPAYLERMRRWDEDREAMEQPPSAKVSLPSPLSRIQLRPPPPSRAASELSNMRRAETDFVVEELYDISMQLEICELDSQGGYAGVPVYVQGPLDPGSFHVRQGLQRKVKIKLSHMSGRALPMKAITKISFSKVRLLEPDGAIIDSSPGQQTHLKLDPASKASCEPDGTVSLIASAVWDSSVHNSDLLNKCTSSSQRILVRATFAVEISTCETPAQFTFDIALRILSRTASAPDRFAFSLFGAASWTTSSRAVFSLTLEPPITHSARDLWRLNTAGSYVKGEEQLKGWKPRAVSVVEDWKKLVKQERRVADVQAMTTIIASHGLTTTQVDACHDDQLLKKSLALWKKKFGTDDEVCFAS